MPSATIKNEHVRHVFASNVRALLNDHEWSESELARRANISQKAVNLVVRQETGIGMEAASLIAAAFKVELWAMLLEELPLNIPALGRLSALATNYVRCSEDDRRYVDEAAKRGATKRKAARA